MVGGQRSLPSEICTQSDPPPSRNADFDRFPLIMSQPQKIPKKVQLCRVESRPRAFQRAIDGVRTLPLSPERVPQRESFHFLSKSHRLLVSGAVNLVSR